MYRFKLFPYSLIFIIYNKKNNNNKNNKLQYLIFFILFYFFFLNPDCALTNIFEIVYIYINKNITYFIN